ncbi:MAG: PAS domain-containing protein, partial [Pseudomonadota bacterium]
MHALELAGVGAWNWDIRSGEVRWTSHVAPLLGLKPGEDAPSYDTFLSCVHPDDRPSITDAIKAAVSQGAVYDVEYRVTNPDGKVRWLSSKGNVIRDGSGYPQHMLGIISDVTDQHIVAQEKARSYLWIQVIHEAGILVNASLEGVGDFKPVIAALRKLIAIDHFMIVLVECDEAVFAVVDTTPGRYSKIKPGTRFPLSGSFVDQLGREGRPRVIADLAQSPAFPENRLIAEDGMRSCVRLPLLHGGTYLGMLAIASHHPHAFDPASLPYLESL